MGKYRFKLSHMMPNAWFYKLKDVGGTRNKSSNSDSSKKKQFPAVAAATLPFEPKQPHQSYPRKSYYYTRECHSTEKEIHNFSAKPKSVDTHFPQAPKRSPRQRIKRRSTVNSPKLVSASCAIWTKSDSPPDYLVSLSDSSSDLDFCDSFPPEFRSDSVLTSKLDSNANFHVIDVDKRSLQRKFDKLDVFDNMSNLDLPPIITKPANCDEKVKNLAKKDASKEAKKYRKSLAAYEEEGINMKERKQRVSVGRHSMNSPGVRLRANSPRLASRRIQAHGRKSVSMSSCWNSSARKSLSESLAIVKSSFDPQRDFRDSMVDMIVENNIRASKDLEDLLACYLSLNSDEYHDLIIKVFKQIWFDLTHIQLK